jgi:purine-binding chemotaxis protein CheW
MSDERGGLSLSDPRSVAPVTVDGAKVREFLAFVVSDELYGLPLSSIRQILRPPRITPVPRAARDIIGIIPVRGTVTTLIDLRRRLRVAETTPGPRARVLLVDQGDEVFGVLVDEVLQVVRLEEGQMELASVLGNDTAAYVLGIGRPGVVLRRGDHVERMSERAARQEVLVLLDPATLLRQRVQES